MKRNNLILFVTIFYLNALLSPVSAENQAVGQYNASNANTIFNWAEQFYFQFFPNNQSIFPDNSKTHFHESGWIYRYYPATDNYVGIYNDDVYVAGASFTTEPINIFSVAAAINIVHKAASHAGSVGALGVELPFRVMHSKATLLDIRNGGYGSACAAHPRNRNQFYALTDRGPTMVFNGEAGKGKIFLFPDYSPRIGLFELKENGTVAWLKDIVFKDTQGIKMTGLPNSQDLGGTGEIPYGSDGKVLRNAQGNIRWDNSGLNSEGLVALRDGTFWVSDEYGPHIVHFDAEGQELERINPFVNDTRAVLNLPAEFSKRGANQSMEGLAITPDQKTLVGIMQSTLENPDNGVLGSKLTRIVSINLETGLIGQYLYKQDKKQNSNSEIVALTATQFLVIERDGDLLNGGSKKASSSAQKLIYKIDLRTGTNLEAVPLTDQISQDDALGLMLKGRTLEQAVRKKGWGYLENRGIIPVQKTEIIDMVSARDYPHDKMEGLWLIDSHTIGILNDDDFGLWPKNGIWEYKYINAERTQVDKNVLYIINNLNLSNNIE